MAGKPELLVIDDDPMILESLNILFKREYKVYTAENGQNGISLVQQHPSIKVVISDQRMPGLLGHETLRQIKLLNPYTVRLLLTGYSDLEAILNSVNSGEVFRFINKPWNPDSLLKVVELGFQIYTRLEKLQADATIKKAEESVHTKNKSDQSGSVLFVESHKTDLQELVNQFTPSYQSIGVSSPEEALKVLSEQSFSVVVSNVDFQDSDPIEFLSAVSHEYPNAVTVIYTELRDGRLAIRAINELNVFRYLIKPTDRNQLTQVIENALNRNKARERKLEGNIIQIGKELAPEKSEVGTLRDKIESSPYLLRLRTLRQIRN